MILQTQQGYVVVTNGGKQVGGPYHSKAMAKRLDNRTNGKAHRQRPKSR